MNLQSFSFYISFNFEENRYACNIIDNCVVFFPFLSSCSDDGISGLLRAVLYVVRPYNSGNCFIWEEFPDSVTGDNDEFVRLFQVELLDLYKKLLIQTTLKLIRMFLPGSQETPTECARPSPRLLLMANPGVSSCAIHTLCGPRYCPWGPIIGSTLPFIFSILACSFGMSGLWSSDSAVTLIPPFLLWV